MKSSMEMVASAMALCVGRCSMPIHTFAQWSYQVRGKDKLAVSGRASVRVVEYPSLWHSLTWEKLVYCPRAAFHTLKRPDRSMSEA